jgi:hypothetical protein
MQSIRNILYIIRGLEVVYIVISLQYNLSVSHHLFKSIVEETDNTWVKWNRHSTAARWVGLDYCIIKDDDDKHRDKWLVT